MPIFTSQLNQTNYEQGAFSTIQMSWENETRRLTLEKRSGQYPGMPAQQAFRIVLHGDGVTTRQIVYTGEPVEVGF